MKLRYETREKQSAVSPVIGVILMVAITVILAAVIGTFVMGMKPPGPNPQAGVDFNFDPGEQVMSATVISPGNVDRLNLSVNGASFAVDNTGSGDIWKVDTSNNVVYTTDDVKAGATVTIGVSGSGEDVELASGESIDDGSYQLIGVVDEESAVIDSFEP